MKSYFTSNFTRVPPMTIPELIPNEGAANISLMFGLHGATHTVATACASGTDAIGNALDVIRSGRYDVILAGGAESTICGFGTLSFTVLHALSSKWVDDPSKACRPFDKNRDGFIMGEGESHAWVEAVCDNNYIAFDPTHNTEITDEYIKLGTGRDAADCAINRGVMWGGGKQTQEINVIVDKYY